MKILIETPTWLGDAIMTTPAIENLTNFFNEPKITLIGSSVSINVLKNNPLVIQTHLISKNYISLYKIIKGFDEFDIFITFRGSFRSRFLKFFISSKSKFQFNKHIYKKGHQVEKYNNFINHSLQTSSFASNLIIHRKKKDKNGEKKILGLNPGASYGSSKRWYPKEFADVALALSSDYDIVIFGGYGEQDIAADIEKYLNEYGVQNYQNLAAKTSIDELVSHISSLDLFITGDSGPMHLAAAFQIPTVTIFGSTNHKETSQWMNDNGVFVRTSLACQPCMKRICPLKHHNCMKLLKAEVVLKAVQGLN